MPLKRPPRRPSQTLGTSRLGQEGREGRRGGGGILRSAAIKYISRPLSGPLASIRLRGAEWWVISARATATVSGSCLMNWRNRRCRLLMAAPLSRSAMGLPHKGSALKEHHRRKGTLGSNACCCGLLVVVLDASNQQDVHVDNTGAFTMQETENRCRVTRESPPRSPRALTTASARGLKMGAQVHGKRARKRPLKGKKKQSSPLPRHKHRHKNSVHGIPARCCMIIGMSINPPVVAQRRACSL